MRKLILFIFVIILPAIIVGISNFFVFPDSSWAATIMLIVTVGISAVFTWQSGNATRRVSVYSLCADFVIAVILAVNLAGHWILSREYSASKQGVAERRLEEDREELRSQARVERELALKKADKDLQDSERRRLRLLPPDQRHSTLATPKVDPTKVPLIQPMSLLPPGSKVETFSKLSPEEVLAKWW